MIFDDSYYNPVDAEDELLAGEGFETDGAEDALTEGTDDVGVDPQLQDNEVPESWGEQPEPAEEGAVTEGEEIAPEDDDPMTALLKDWTARAKQQQPTANRQEEYDFLQVVQGSDLIKSIIKMRQNGYSEEQVQRAMGNAYLKTYGNEGGQQTPKEEQEPIDLSDPNVLAQFIQQTVQNSVQQAVTPYQKQQQEYQQQAAATNIRTHNDQVLLNSLQRVGLDAQLTQEQGESLRVVAQALYPGLNITRDKLSQAQTDAIVTMALGTKMKTKDVPRNLRAPQIASGKATSTSRENTARVQKTHGLTRTERAQNFNNLLKNIGG